MENSPSAVSQEVANELLYMAYKEMTRYPSLRLGQAIINIMPNSLLPEPWPEMFYQEDPTKAAEIFYSRVDNNGRRVNETNKQFVQLMSDAFPGSNQ